MHCVIVAGRAREHYTDESARASCRTCPATQRFDEHFHIVTQEDACCSNELGSSPPRYYTARAPRATTCARARVTRARSCSAPWHAPRARASTHAPHAPAARATAAIQRDTHRSASALRAALCKMSRS